MANNAPLVLVVDDTQNIASSIVYILQSAGFRASMANSALECVSKARAEHPSLIVMDIMMPGMDGSTAAGIMQDTPELQGIPVVLLSAMPEDEVRDRARESGAVDWLTKPFRRDNLLKKVRQWAGDIRPSTPVPVAS